MLDQTNHTPKGAGSMGFDLFVVNETQEIYPVSRFQGLIPQVRLLRRREIVPPTSTEIPACGLTETDTLQIRVFLQLANDVNVKKENASMGRPIYSVSRQATPVSTNDVLSHPFVREMDENGLNEFGEFLRKIRHYQSKIDTAQSRILYNPPAPPSLPPTSSPISPQTWGVGAEQQPFVPPQPVVVQHDENLQKYHHYLAVYTRKAILAANAGNNEGVEIIAPTTVKSFVGQLSKVGSAFSPLEVERDVKEAIHAAISFDVNS